MFSTHLTIFERVSNFDPRITEDDVLSWCLDLETMQICDVEVMAHFKDVPLEVNPTTKLAVLPCNIFRIMHVYDESDSIIPFSLFSRKSHIKIPDNKKAFISYIGIPFDDNGDILIANNHIPAPETWIKLKIKEIDHFNGNYDPKLYAQFEYKLGNQITQIKQQVINLTVDHFDKLNVIRYNMIPTLGRERLYHKRFV